MHIYMPIGSCRDTKKVSTYHVLNNLEPKEKNSSFIIYVTIFLVDIEKDKCIFRVLSVGLLLTLERKQD